VIQIGVKDEPISKTIYAALHHESNFAGRLRPGVVIFACAGPNWWNQQAALLWDRLDVYQ